MLFFKNNNNNNKAKSDVYCLYHLKINSTAHPLCNTEKRLITWDTRHIVYSKYCAALFTKLQIILDSSENTSHTQNLVGQTTQIHGKISSDQQTSWLQKSCSGMYMPVFKRILQWAVPKGRTLTTARKLCIPACWKKLQGTACVI